MEKIIFENDIKVFGIEVKNFPAGISEAFDELIQKTGDCAGAREYYGVSSMDDKGRMLYKAVAEEKFDGEANQYGYPKSIIERGEYLFTALREWQTKTHCIKDIFYEMIKDERVDKTKPCVEWYKSSDEMLCMMKTIA